MELGKTLYVTDRAGWRTWLAKNHDREKEIWLVYCRKSSNKPRITYDDAVREALCFGWIDSTVKNIDGARFAQRFSPRHAKSSLSQANRERVCQPVRQKRMTPAGLKAIAAVFDPSDDRPARFRMPPDILWPLKANKAARANFQKMPAAYRRVRIAFIDSRRRHGREMFRRSLEHFIGMTAKNKKFGMLI